MVKNIPIDATAAFNFGLRARKEQNEAAALPVLLQATQAHPQHAGLWQVLGLLYRGLDQLEPATAALARAAALAPQDALIAHAHARANLEAGLPAVHLFDIAHNLAPSDGAILIGRSAAQLAEGDVNRAIADLDAVLRRNPAWEEGHSALSRLLWLTGHQDKFTASVTRALADTPHSPLLWKQLITTLFQARQHDAVIAAIGDARSALGQNDAFLVFETCAISELGDFLRAETLFDAIADVEDIMPIEFRVRHLLRSGNIEAAAELAEHYCHGSYQSVLLPYLCTAWRLLGDGRRHLYESDPALIGTYDIGDRLPPLDRLADVLRRLHQGNHAPLEQSLRGGTQTDGALFSRIEPEIQALRKAVCASVDEYIAGLAQGPDSHPTATPIRFTGSWSVRLHGSGFHANHVHQAGWISSVLYVSLPPSEQMGDAPAGWLALGQPPAELNLDVPALRQIEPKAGRLVLFPSTMWHGTIPFDAGERLTVAFDVAARPSSPI